MPKKTKSKVKITKRHIDVARKVFGGGGALTPAEQKLYKMHGSGFWGDLWSGVKKGFNFLKDNKIVSTVAKLIPHPVAQQVGNVAGQLGMGKRGYTNTISQSRFIG